MGNNNSQLSLCDNLVKQLSQQAVDLHGSCLVNQETCKEYLLKRRLRPKSYLASTDGEDVQLDIINCKSFKTTKAVTLMARKLSEFKTPLIEHVVDFFAFKETGLKEINVAIVTRSSRGIRLDDWLTAENGGGEVEAILEAFFYGLDMLRCIHSDGAQIGFISTRTVEIYRDERALAFRLRYLSSTIESGQMPPEGNTNTALADVWGAGVILFSLLTNIPASECALGLKLQHERLCYIKTKLNDVGLTELVTMCCSNIESRKSCDEILAHRYVKWWRQPDFSALRIDLLQALSTQLKFSDSKAQVAAYRGFFQLASTDTANVFSFIQLQNYDWETLIKAFIDMHLESEASEGAMQLLISAMKHIKGMRRLLIRAGTVDYLLRRNFFIEFRTLMAFLCEMCKKTTSSLPVLLYERKVHVQALKNCSSCLYAYNFISSTAPYFGNYSVKLILQACEQGIWNYAQAVEMLQKVPFQNLSQNKQAILELIEDCVNSLIVTHFNFSSSLLNTLKLLSSVLSVTEVFEHSSQRGSCLSCSEFAFAVELSRCPLVIFCADCAVPVCTFCGATCHSACKMRPLFPQSFLNSCQCSQTHEASPSHYPTFNIKKRSLYLFKSSNQAVVENPDPTMYRISSANYFGHPITVISNETLLSDDQYDGSNSTAFYFEVKILSAGPRDAISIGLEDLQYQSWTGLIVDDKMAVVRTAVPYGSHDYVGVGITHNRQAYFTLNGLMMHPMMPLKSFKLKLAFLSEDAEVLLLFDPERCLFQPKNSSLLDDLRFRAMESIPKSLSQKLEVLLLENYSYFEEERRLDDLLIFLSSQFSGKVGQMMLARAMRSSTWGDRSCTALQCLML